MKKSDLTEAILLAVHRPPALRQPEAPAAKAVVSRASNVPIAAPGSPVAASEGKKGQDVAETGVWRFTVPGIPMGKPRMTQRDKWAKRPCVLRYRAWADIVRAAAPWNLPPNPRVVSWTAYFPIPKSWPPKCKEAALGILHDQKPDRDNVDKATLDILFKSDKSVAAGTLVKRYDDGHGPRIEIEVRLRA